MDLKEWNYGKHFPELHNFTKISKYFSTVYISISSKRNLIYLPCPFFGEICKKKYRKKKLDLTFGFLVKHVDNFRDRLDKQKSKNLNKSPKWQY